MRKINTLVLFLLLVGTTVVNAQIFVSQLTADTATHDGTSWATAFDKLEDAIDAASVGDEIWVGFGEYAPPVEIVPNGATMDTTNTFFIDKDLKLYGGFVGVSETSIDQRNPLFNPTILNADILDNDIINRTDTLREDNGHHVLYLAENTTDQTLIDGFVIWRGHAITTATAFDQSAYKGGGIFCTGGSPTIKNCVINECHALTGGAIFIQASDEGSVVIEDCDIDRNAASLDGSGIFVSGVDSMTIINTKISRNKSVQNAAISIFNVEELIVQDCEIRNNDAANFAALYCDDNANLLFDNVEFRDNASTGAYAMLMNNRAGATSGATFNQCYIEDNSADTISAGIDHRVGNISMTNCLVANNVCKNGNIGSAWVSADNITLNHVSIVNQDAPALAQTVGGLNTINSIYQANGTGFFVNVGSAGIISSGGNLCSDASMASGLTEGTDVNNMDPQLKDLAAGNYIPQISSPCLDAAVASSVTVDLTNTARDANPDMGALENRFVSTTQQQIAGTSIELFPTIAKENIQIKWESTAFTKLEYQVINLRGGVLRAGTLATSLEEIDVNQLAAGQYQVIFSTNNERTTRTFIKM